MDDKSPWLELIERAKNFEGYQEGLIEEAYNQKEYYQSLASIYMGLEADMQKLRGIDPRQMFKMVFSRVFDFNASCILHTRTHVRDAVFDACLFTTLGMFLHESKRIKGGTLREFVYKHSDSQYNKIDSSNHFYLESMNKKFLGSTLFNSEEESFRQMRHRRLTERPVHNDTKEWSAMKDSSAHEWTFYYDLNSLKPDMQDTFKRLGNLYNDISKAKRLVATGASHKKDHDAYKKFVSKLNKIKYEKYLELSKAALMHICQDKTYYGMNIYRFERQLKPFGIIRAVQHLETCKNVEEEKLTILKSVLLEDIHFPKVYLDFSTCDNLEKIDKYAKSFSCLKDATVHSCRLILDKLIENNYFADWQNVFRDTINEMTDRVFYNPEELDFTITPNSQKNFVKLLSEPVRLTLSIN